MSGRDSNLQPAHSAERLADSFSLLVLLGFAYGVRHLLIKKQLMPATNSLLVL